MSLVNEALRKAAQQTAANRSPSLGGAHLGAPTYEPTDEPVFRNTLPLVAVTGSTLLVAVLLVVIIVLIKTTGGPKDAAAVAIAEPVSKPAAKPAKSEPPVVPPTQMQTQTQTPASTLDVRPHLNTPTPAVPATLPPTPAPAPAPQPQTLPPWVNPNNAATPVTPTPVTPTPALPTPAPTPGPTPGPAPTAPEQVAAPAKPALVPGREYLRTVDAADCPKLELQAIIFSDSLKAALINNRTVEVGDPIDGVTVEAISAKHVTLRAPAATPASEGVQFRLRLP